MNDDERDALLIKLDVSQDYIKDAHSKTHALVEKVSEKVESHDKDLRRHKTQINTLKWVGTVGAAIASYFKWGQ